MSVMGMCSNNKAFMNYYYYITFIVIIICVFISCDSVLDSDKKTNPPVINRIESNPATSPANRLPCSDTVLIIVDASSPDGKQLLYTWEADGGDFDGDTDRQSVRWIAPVRETDAEYEITAVVSDGDLASRESITIFVAAVAIPVVETADITDITQHSAVGGGDVIDCRGSEVTARGVVWSTSENPTLDDYNTSDGYGTGSFTSTLTDLQPERTYYVRAYAINSAGTAYGDQIHFTTEESGQETGTVVDIDGNVYRTITIGSQSWMTENLRTTRYRNGDILPHITDDTEWQNLNTGAWTYYENDPSNDEIYGKLYNWYAVADEREICPPGWQVPSDDDWKQLEIFLGMSKLSADDEGTRGTNEGGKMKSTRTVPDPHPRWNSPNTGATNETGLSMLPGGYRSQSGYFGGKGNNAYFWPSLPGFSKLFSWNRELSFNESGIARNRFDKRSGFSVRCVRK